eukprot:TRINITY_DN5346_c0_g2_i1.p1 TRINITY_DN5346_c0_g2~~TRINITY_DN5346_c0_g2_i1.p1  ORF type:complete len:811 (-),score=81.28 TRINITY_DN5346_c0_g2_i1:133-2322(-)
MSTVSQTSSSSMSTRTVPASPAEAVVALVEGKLKAATVEALAEVNVSQLNQDAVVKLVTAPGKEPVTVAAMTTEGAVAKGGKLEIPFASDEAGSVLGSVEIPASAVQASAAGGGPVVVAITVMGASRHHHHHTSGAPRTRSQEALPEAALEGSSSKLSGDLVALSMFDQNSNPISVEHLEEPIIFKVSNNASADAFCVFWDASFGDWSEEGVTRLPSQSYDLSCSTTHLSIFGAIVKTFECSNAAALFSHHAMNSISNGKWASSGPSIAMWLTISAFVVFMMFAAWLDRRDSKMFEDNGYRRSLTGRARFETLRQTSQSGGTTASQEVREEGPILSWCKWVLGIVLELGLTLVEAGVGKFKAVYTALLNAWQAPRVIVESAVSEAQSFQLGVNSESVATMRKFEDGLNLSDEAQIIITSHEVYQLSRVVAQQKDLENNGDRALDSFLHRSSAYRFFCLCAALNPVVAMTSFSLYGTHLTRACLFCLRVAGAAAANAIFYDISALPKDMTQDLLDRCAKKDSFGWVSNLVVGITSTLVSDGVMFFLISIRGMQYPELALLDGEEIPLPTLEHRIRASQVRGTIFWLILISYSGICFYIVLAFNSSVSERDQEEWLLACFWTLLELLVLECMLGALIMTILCGFVFCCSSSIKPSVHQARSFSGRFSRLTSQVRQSVMGRLSRISVVPAGRASAEPASEEEDAPAEPKTWAVRPTVIRLSAGIRSSTCSIP